MKQTSKGLHRTDIGKQAQLLAHGEQSLFRTHLGSRIVVELRMPHSSKEHSIRLHAELEGFLGEWVAYLIDGMGTAESFTIAHLMTKLGGNGVHHSHTLLHNFWPDTITGQYSNFQFHTLYFLFFSLL